jgi:ubiquitin fusion degradation protein 1
MMNNIGLAPGDFVTIQSTELPRGSFVKFRPKQVAFLDISDPRAVYESLGCFIAILDRI